MQPTTFQYDTELSAINSILAAIGQAPIPKLNYENPEVHLIANLLQESNRDMQAEGWVYNTERNYPISTNSKNEIVIPDNVLRIDMSENDVYRTTNVVKRNGKLYNKMTHSYKFEPGAYNFDIVWLFPFEDLPTIFQRYITYRASTRAASQIVTNPELVKLLASQEALSRAACMEYECNQGDYTMFGTPDNTSYRPYQPYRALAR